MPRFDRTRVKTARARTLRQNATRPEQKLWFHLRAGPMNGNSFRRQHPVGPYVLDFYCPAAKVAIEIDGDQHGSDRGLARDAIRSRFLEAKGIRVLRFWNGDVMQHLDCVLETIARALTPTGPALPVRLPLSGGGHAPC